MLDDTGGGDFRMIFGRERDEPRVIFVLIRSLVVGLAFPDRRVTADNLRGAGLAAYDHVVQVRFVCGATDAADDVRHRILYSLERPSIARDSRFNFRRIRRVDNTVPT